MTIEPFSLEFVQGCCDLYNRQTAHEPHIVRLTPARFGHFISAKPYFDASGFLVAHEGPRVVGWVHACLVPYTDNPAADPSPWPRIQMLLFEPERPELGLELVRQATQYLRNRSTQTPTALHPTRGYPFYRGLWMGGEPQLLTTLPHVQMALEASGYAESHRDVMMTVRLDERPKELRPAAAVEFTTEPLRIKHDVMRHSWTGFEPQSIHAHLKGQWAGTIGWVLVPQTAERMGVASLNIYTLGVSSNCRRQGIGAALSSRAMTAGFDLGAREFNVCTQVWNAPAQATYAKCGMRPHVIVNGRSLRNGA